MLNLLKNVPFYIKQLLSQLFYKHKIVKGGLGYLDCRRCYYCNKKPSNIPCIDCDRVIGSRRSYLV